MNWRVRLDLALDVSLASECTERPPSFLKGWDGTQRNSQREIGGGKMDRDAEMERKPQNSYVPVTKTAATHLAE